MAKMKNELLEAVLKEQSEHFTEEYVETGFFERYKLIKKMIKNLSEDEKELFYKMSNEETNELYRIVKYFLTGDLRL